MRQTSRLVQRRLITGHSPFEAIMGFSRAVVVGGHVYVAGTAPIPADGSPPPEDAYEQARLCLQIVRDALERAGASLEDVVRTRVYLTDPAHFDGVARAHGEAFRDIRPATAMVEVRRLIDADMLVEIEADAVVADVAGPAG